MPNEIETLLDGFRRIDEIEYRIATPGYGGFLYVINARMCWVYGHNLHGEPKTANSQEDALRMCKALCETQYP